MLGISQEIWNKVAQMPTKHSWAKELLLLPEEKIDEAEDKMAQWLEKWSNPKDEESEMALRIVREVYPLYLEREAIKAFLKQNPSYSEILMNPQTTAEAVMLGAREAMVTDKVSQAQAELQLQFLEGEQMPDLKEILGEQ